MANSYRFKIGETVTVALQAVGAVDADLASITITALIKLSTDGTVPPIDAPAVAVFDCVFRSASIDVGSGWNLSLTAEQTSSIVGGDYVTNAVLTFADGTVQKTDPLFLSFAVATQ